MKNLQLLFAIFQTVGIVTAQADEVLLNRLFYPSAQNRIAGSVAQAANQSFDRSPSQTQSLDRFLDLISGTLIRKQIQNGEGTLEVGYKYIGFRFCWK